MKDINFEQILMEVLRIGLIATRNALSMKVPEPENVQLASKWAMLCHSLPPVLMGECDLKAVCYFYQNDGVSFLENYPRKGDADYLQIVRLLAEIEAAIRRV